MVSSDAASMAVSTLSKLEGITISPFALPLFEWMLTWILPILPVLWSSLKSKSLLSKPSVCPNTAPTTSGFSTIPLAVI
jgi:hypothetical protein